MGLFMRSAAEQAQGDRSKLAVLRKRAVRDLHLTLESACA